MVLYGADQLTDRRQAYALLALSAREQWGLSPLPSLAHGPKGKPYFPGTTEWEFNLSHSGPLALCVLDSRPVGVDIQVIKAHRPGLPAKVCSAAELDWLDRGPDRWSRFTLLWTLKECRAKYSGTGLTSPIAQIAVPLPSAGEELVQLDGLWFGIYTGEGWYASVCGETPPPRDILWRTLAPDECGL